MYASSKWPMGFNDKAFNTSGWALDGPGPNKSLEGTYVLGKWVKSSLFSVEIRLASVKDFNTITFKLD